MPHFIKATVSKDAVVFLCKAVVLFAKRFFMQRGFPWTVYAFCVSTVLFFIPPRIFRYRRISMRRGVLLRCRRMRTGACGVPARWRHGRVFDRKRQRKRANGIETAASAQVCRAVNTATKGQASDCSIQFACIR